MLEPLPLWKSTLKSVAFVDNGSWASNLASWLDQRTSRKLAVRPIIGNVIFTFQRGLFETQLKSCAPIDIAMSASLKIASAWESAIMASPIIILPGSSLGAPTPATTWSVVAAIIDPPSVMAGKALLIAKLASAAAVDDGGDSHMAEAFRSASQMLTVTATGINSLPIPTPLLAPFTPTF